MKRAAAAYSAGLLIFGVAVGWNFFSTALQPGLLASLFLTGFACIAAGSGRLALRAFALPGLGELEKTVIGTTLGLGILSIVVFFLAALGLLRPWAVAVALGLLAIVSIGEIRSMAAAFQARNPGVLGATVFVLLALSFWTAWVPPHQYDALVYHLPLPAAYLRTGRLTIVEHLIYSHFPQNAEMLFSLGLMTGSELVPQLFCWLATALSVGWVFTESKGRIPDWAVWLACLIVASHTSVMLLAAMAYVEAFVMLWLCAGVLCWVRASQTAQARTRRNWLVLAGVFAGLAVGTKYTAGLCAAVLAFFCLERLRRGWSAREIVSFALPAALCGLPWLVKNWIVLGNPVFPFLFRYLPHRGIAWGEENASRYFRFLTEYGHAPGHYLSDLFWVHYRAAFGAVNLGGGMDVIGTLGWAIIFALVPVAAWAALKDKRLAWIGIYCLLHWAAWFSSVVVLRYLTAIVPLMAILGAAGLSRLAELGDRTTRSALAAGLSLLLACNVGLFLCVHTLLGSWKPLLGLESDEQYLSRMLDYYPCASWARTHLQGDDRVLLVGEQRSFYVAQDSVATTPMAPNRFVDWANESHSPAELAHRLKTEGGFSDLIVVPREAKRLGLYGVFAFTEAGHRNWDGLEHGPLKPAFEGSTCAVLGIS